MKINQRAYHLLCLALLLNMSPAIHAQDANNILGLPAVPQARAADGTFIKSPVTPTGPVEASEGEIKAMLSGSMALASLYQNGQITVRVTTGKAFTGDKTRRQILQAARLVQRDVVVPCGKLCKPAAMPAPKFLPDNTLTFDIVIQGYAGLLSTTDMINLVSGKSISPATGPAPVAVAVPTVPAVPATPAAPSQLPPPARPASAPAP